MDEYGIDVMPHIDHMAELELIAIFELLSSDFAVSQLAGYVGLREFLRNVHVLQTISHSQAEEASREGESAEAKSRHDSESG